MRYLVLLLFSCLINIVLAQGLKQNIRRISLDSFQFSSTFIRLRFVPRIAIFDPILTKSNRPTMLSFKSPYKYWDELGILCKWELKNDKITKYPVRFRLGSYEYVNKMEGK